MSNKSFLQKMLTLIVDKFGQDTSKMLIVTGVAGWALSSLAQCGAILFNSEFTKEQKSFLLPQELADAAANIGLYFLISKGFCRLASKLFENGKFATKSVRNYIDNHPEINEKVGNIDFSLSKLKKNDFPTVDFYCSKKMGEVIATTTGGVLASNIIAPIVRNTMASKMHNNYIESKKTPYPTKSSIKQNLGLKI